MVYSEKANSDAIPYLLLATALAACLHLGLAALIGKAGIVPQFQPLQFALWQLLCSEPLDSGSIRQVVHCWLIVQGLLRQLHALQVDLQPVQNAQPWGVFEQKVEILLITL